NMERLQWGDGSFTFPDNFPVLTTAPVSAQPNQTFLLSSLFSVSDPDGDPITAYRIYAGAPNGGPAAGVFSIGGVAQAKGAVLDITPAQMPSVTFNTGGASAELDIYV